MKRTKGQTRFYLTFFCNTFACVTAFSVYELFLSDHQTCSFDSFHCSVGGIPPLNELSRPSNVNADLPYLPPSTFNKDTFLKLIFCSFACLIMPSFNTSFKGSSGLLCQCSK